MSNQHLLELAEQYASEAHQNQVRKYRPEPYFNHLRNVALLVAEFADQNQIAAAWLHDTVEDTAVTLPQINQLFGSDISKLVEELTDVYTKDAYPRFNRASRKHLESARLQTISPRAQTIKYADYLDNSVDILLQDPKFAKTYIQEIASTLAAMNRGNSELRQKLLEIISPTRTKDHPLS